MNAERPGHLLRSRCRRGIRWALFSVGFLLSPLTLWNDLWVNVPLSLLIAPVLVALTGMGAFTAVAVCYAGTNLLGIVLMGIALLPPLSRAPARSASVVALPPRRRRRPKRRPEDHRRAA